MLTRRGLLLAGAAGPLAALSRTMPTVSSAPIFPPRLRLGDRVAIVAPAGVSGGAESLAQAKANVESLGLRVTVGPHAADQWGYLAGTDADRAADMNWALRDPEIRGIFCLRGGYGTMRMVPHVVYAAFKRDPKIVMGYSDITGLLNALTRKTGIVTYHGPIAEAKFLGFEGEWMRKAIFEGETLGLLGTPTELRGRAAIPAPRTVNPGQARGRLVGGNLSLITPMLGTPYGPDLKDTILFIEDINEAPYKVDRMLTSLWLHRAFRQVKGIVIGDFRPPRDEEPDPSDRAFSIDQVFDNLLQWTNVPIFTGLYAGHIADKLTLPIGANVVMDADARTLRVVEES